MSFGVKHLRGELNIGIGPVYIRRPILGSICFFRQMVEVYENAIALRSRPSVHCDRMGGGTKDMREKVTYAE